MTQGTGSERAKEKQQQRSPTPAEGDGTMMGWTDGPCVWEHKWQKPESVCGKRHPSGCDSYGRASEGHREHKNGIRHGRRCGGRPDPTHSWERSRPTDHLLCLLPSSPAPPNPTPPHRGAGGGQGWCGGRPWIVCVRSGPSLPKRSKRPSAAGCCPVRLHWLDRRGAAASPTPRPGPRMVPCPPGRRPLGQIPS